MSAKAGPRTLRPTIAVVQFSPKIGRVEENIKTAWRFCEKLAPGSIDLVCLPEMAFTGYVFPDASSIAPYLEEPQTGPTSRFCAELASRLRCYVTAGYPEKLPQEEVEVGVDSEGLKFPKIGANSAVLYGPNGEWVGGYRKTNLFETDMTWAKAGSGFISFDLPPPLGIVTLGICMDLNAQPPAIWTLEGPYEIAEYCILKKTNLLVMLNAWLDSGKDAESEYDLDTLNYWARRLWPLWEHEAPEADAIKEPLSGLEHVPETAVVICNRCGEENGKTFAGSSALLSLRSKSGKPRVLDVMTRHQEGLEIWTIHTSAP
ncbi:carbon-nitrogen hydrolase [Obba rivulosa]|uniref:Carbon-nitrogen hydrolase n=1 Tax=Obba rivulosa TaxID=1052685 RepID=A0A8E2AYF2_9APHY|nr:carbon-nitrogen hydrolase [Obba rivulosa]